MAFKDFVGAGRYSPLGILKGNSKNPYEQARPFLEQMGPMAEKHYNPYIEQGQQAGNQAYGQYSQMAEKPGDFLNDLFSNYQQI